MEVSTRRAAMRSVLACSAMAVTVLLASACSSSSGDGVSSGGSAAPTSSPGLAAATAFLARYTSNPTSILLTTPLSEAPPTGKTVVTLTTPEPVALRNQDAQQAAAKVLGWHVIGISTGDTSASAVAAFEAGLADRPAAIIFAGYPASLFTQQIAQAKSEGIAVVSDATGDGPVNGVLGDIGGQSQEELYGKMVAAYFVVHSDGKGKAAVFNIAAYPILTQFTDAFNSAVKQWCPACTSQVVNQQISDIGTNTPANVVSFLQRNPSVKWTVFANGDLAQGVSSAIRTAGISGINIIGEVPSQADIAALRSGTEQAWAGYPVDILGWRMIDLLARHFTNTELPASLQVPLPVQMITSSNVNGIVLGSEGFYVGVKGYQDQFAKLWKVQ